MYYDTDSVIFIEKENENLLNEFIGDYLGELTDETSSKIIGDFIGLGPKNYSFLCENPKKSKTVIKGFTLKNCSEKLNHESLREMLIENVIKKKIIIR